MPHRWNAYIETPERRFFQRCANCGTRRITGLYHEVYDLADACNGQHRDCCHGWGYACQTCTVSIATGCLDRVHKRCDGHTKHLRQLEGKVASQAHVLGIQCLQLAERTKRLTAMHFVWCADGCQNPGLSEEAFAIAYENVQRMRSALNNRAAGPKRHPRDGNGVCLTCGTHDLWYDPEDGDAFALTRAAINIPPSPIVSEAWCRTQHDPPGTTTLCTYCSRCFKWWCGNCFEAHECAG